MQQLAEAIPLLLFFLAFFMKGQAVSVGPLQWEFDGFMSATVVLMIATTVMAAALWLKYRRLEKRVFFLTVLILVTGTLTLAFHNARFLMWKPTLFNWGIALALLGSRLFFRKSLMELTLGKQISLPPVAWRRLDILWFCNTTVVGSLNLFVAYHYSEASWITYKLWSAVGFTLFLSIATATIVAPFLDRDETESSPES